MIAPFIDRPREDSLTAAVFSQLLHLPSEDFWQILHGACFSANFPHAAGEPRAIHLRPNWSAEGTTNSARVIPDLVIEFDDFDLIVEAKRWDHLLQDREQWKRELTAYINEYGPRKRKVKMLALGGNISHEDEHIRETFIPPGSAPSTSHEFICPVHICKWSSLLLECRRWREKLENAEDQSSRTRADMRILNDLIAIFVRHGFTPVRWFKDFGFLANFLDSNSSLDQQHFQNISLQFQHP